MNEDFNAVVEECVILAKAGDIEGATKKLATLCVDRGIEVLRENIKEEIHKVDCVVLFCAALSSVGAGMMGLADAIVANEGPQ